MSMRKAACMAERICCGDDESKDCTGHDAGGAELVPGSGACRLDVEVDVGGNFGRCGHLWSSVVRKRPLRDRSSVANSADAWAGGENCVAVVR